MNTVKFAQDRGATIVAITDNELSPVYQMAEAALLAPSEMISFVDSMVAPLSLINALLIAVGSRMRSDVSRTFAELEDIWNAYGVFGKMDDDRRGSRRDDGRCLRGGAGRTGDAAGAQ